MAFPDLPVPFCGITGIGLCCMFNPHVNICNSISFWILWSMIPSNRMATFNRCSTVITYSLHNIGLSRLSSVTYNLNGTEFNFMLCELGHTKLKSVFRWFRSFFGNEVSSVLWSYTQKFVNFTSWNLTWWKWNNHFHRLGMHAIKDVIWPAN